MSLVAKYFDPHPPTPHFLEAIRDISENFASPTIVKVLNLKTLKSPSSRSVADISENSMITK
jgi:hypothetical protein